MSDDLNKAFNIIPQDVSLPTIAPPPEVSKDFEYSRDNLYTIIDTGQRALKNMFEIAETSQHPKAYEVLASFIKSMVNANKELIDIQIQRQHYEKNNRDAGVDDSHGTVINNNTLIMTSAEMARLVSDQLKAIGK